VTRGGLCWFIRLAPLEHDLRTVPQSWANYLAFIKLASLGVPPTLNERLQLMAARLERRPIVIMPHKCKTVEEWAARYSGLAKR